MLVGDKAHFDNLNGVDAIPLLSSRAPLIKCVGFVNETVTNKLDGLESLVVNGNIDVEHNDTIRVGFYGLLPDPRVNVNDGTSLANLVALGVELYNEDGEVVYSGAKGFDTRDYEQKGYVDLFVNPVDLSPGTYKIVLRIDGSFDNRDFGARVDSGRTMTVHEEQDVKVDEINGSGSSYKKIQLDPETITDMLIEDGALFYPTNTPITEENRSEFIKYLKSLTDGDSSNGELIEVWVYDKSTDVAADLVLRVSDRNDVGSEIIKIYHEKTAYKLYHDFFGINR